MKHFYTLVLSVFLALMIAVPSISLIPRDNGGGGGLSITEPEFGSTFKVYMHEKNEVVTLSAEDYLFGVIAGEISFDYGDEAIKAQIIASYTFAMRRKEQRAAQPDASILNADITDDHTIDQNYLDEEAARSKLGDSYDSCRSRFSELMKDVQGLCMRYDGELILAVYHAISGGRTEAAANVWGSDMAYLKPVESVGDLLDPSYMSTVTYTAQEFLQHLYEMDAGVSGTEMQTVPDASTVDCAAMITQPKCSDSGTVLEYTLNSKVYTGQQIRKYFALRSANFDLTYSNGSFTFTVRGYGHGVGMSQTGAKYMAEQGSSYEEILNWYYTDISIEKYQ